MARTATQQSCSTSAPRCVDASLKGGGTVDTVSIYGGATELVRYRSLGSPMSDSHSGWAVAWLATMGVNVIFTVFMFMSTWCRLLEWKLFHAETKLEQQKEQLMKLEQQEERLVKLEEQKERLVKLEQQEEQLLKLVKMVNALKEKNKENERRVEMQQHELKEQEAVVRELYVALQMKNNPTLLLQSSTITETPKQFRLFRKHSRNLMLITKPCINEVIKASVEAGIVPELVVGESETSSNINCTVFYKALQMKISESPQTLTIFLQMLQEKFTASKALCSKILAELNAV